MDLRVLTYMLLSLLWSYGYGAITTTYRNYDTRKHPFMIELDIPESKITCTNDTNPSAIRCIIKNAIIFAGEVYIIADTGIIIPKILCSAVDVGHSISCRFYIVSRYNMFQLLKKHVKDKRKSIVGIKTESAIYFAGVNGENTYHSLFEEMIPIFEIIQSDRILSKWLDKNDNNIKLAHLYDNSHFSDSYASKFFQTFFPNIDYSFDLSIEEQIKTTYVTDILIMVHGGAVGNAIFLPPYATLIDIYPYTFPFHLNGLVNWIRYALKDIPIAHASFDIINPNHMIFINNFTLPLCSHDKSKRKIESAFTLFWLVERVFIDPERFQSHFRNVFKNWRSRTNYVPPMTKYDFKQYSTSYKEPWYFRYIKKSNPNKNISLPSSVTGWIRFNLTVEDIIPFENCSESSLLDFNSSSSIQNELSFASEKTFIENRFPIQSNNNNYNSYMNTHQQGTMTMTMISTMTMTFPPIEDDILHRSVTLYEQGMVKEAVSVLDNSTLYTGPGGVLWNPHLENHIQNISKYHLQPSDGSGSGIIDRSSGISDISDRSPRRVGYQRPVQVTKILHVVTSLYNVGGHTRVLMSFIEFLSSKSHHIYFTRRLTIHSPSFIYKTISKKNITACKVPDLGCADRLRRMSRSFDLVVLHVHTHDVIPVLAFGTGYKGPQIALFDHADHLGWVGSSVIDVRLVYRQAALRLSSLRGIQWSRNMLMPLPAGDPFMKSNKTTAREQLGFRDNQIVILTMAGKYKYGNTFFFPDIITNILKEFPSVYFIGVGVPDQWKKRFTASRAKTSQWKLLPKGLPGTQAAVYHTAADIHLDSFPFSSITSMLESVLDGGVAISFCPWTSLSHLILCAEAADYGEVLTPLMPNPVLSCRTQDAFLKALRTLIQRPQTLRSLQNLTTQSMRRHTGQGWATAMEGIFDSVLKLPERSPWQIKPIDWTYEI
eukprot:gene7969-16312_t